MLDRPLRQTSSYGGARPLRSQDRGDSKFVDIEAMGVESLVFSVSRPSDYTRPGDLALTYMRPTTFRKRWASRL